MDLRQIRYFLKVIEKGSFSRAAEQLGIAQPGLGAAIRKLEEEFQVQLLLRSSRGVAPTEAGQVLAGAGARILAEVAQADQAMRDLARAPRGQISIGITPSMAERLVLPLIERCQAEMPGLALNVVEELSFVLSEWVEAGRLDFALAYDVPPTRGLVLRPLATERICLIEPGEAAQNAPIDFAELGTRKLGLPPRPHRLRMLVEAAASERGVPLHVAYEMHSVPTILRLVRSGLGSTLLAGAALREAQAGLVRRPVTGPSMNSRLALIHADNRPLTRIETVLLRIVRELMKA